MSRKTGVVAREQGSVSTTLGMNPHRSDEGKAHACRHLLQLKCLLWKQAPVNIDVSKAPKKPCKRLTAKSIPHGVHVADVGVQLRRPAFAHDLIDPRLFGANT